MSAPGYLLETARRPPPPLRLQHTSKRNSNIPNAAAPSEHETLLYDLPSTAPLSPPLSEGEVVSPTSPNYSGRSRHRIPASGRASPLPSQRTRSATPSRMQVDVEAFAERCRKWYFDQDQEAGRQMTQILATLPPGQHAPFSRLQASIRSAYHASVNARRNAEFRAHLSATHPGGSLTPLSRADPTGCTAQKERYEAFERFVRGWCTVGMPGTKPFFEGLWTLMRLQVVPPRLGGAGGHLIHWEIDDAVFKEAGGKDFMLEAVDMLKGVLGFNEHLSTRTPISTLSSSAHAFSAPSHARSQSQPLRSKPSVPTRLNPAVQDSPLAKRPRAPSDPFLDTPAPALSHSYSSSPLSSSIPLSASLSDTVEDSSSPSTPPQEVDDIFNPRPAATYGSSLEIEEEYMRTWTSPDLTNPEIFQLLKVFPTFITRRSTPRFPEKTPGSHPPPDLEAGQEPSAVVGEIRIGTGRMWVGVQPRTEGWEGSWWTKFKNWWHRLFC